MSWDVTLRDPAGQPYTDVPHHQGGGTTIAGGYSESWLNVTYNYAQVYRIFEFSLEDLRGRVAGDPTLIAKMEQVVQACGHVNWSDYWAPTPGNAGAALETLLSWAKKHPEGVWEVS